MKRLMTVLVAAIAGVASAGTLYVNNAAGVGNDEYDGRAAVWDGTHGPKQRIQAAVAAAESGDTVLVAPGVYGDEQGTVDRATAGHTCRVYIDRALTLKASGAKSETHIVGRRLVGEPGWGDGAVTAIRIASGVGSGAGNDRVVIEGFTIRDCASDGTEYGGVIGWRSSTVPDLANGSGPWVVNCTISNCVYGVSGGLYHVNAARVFLKDNYSDQVGVNAHQCNLVYCVANGCYGQAGYNGTAAQYIINCTFCNTRNNPFSSSSKVNLRNTMVTASSSIGVWCTTAFNCVMKAVTATGETGSNHLGDASLHSQIAGPLIDDFRPLVQDATYSPDAAACGNGDASFLELVPAEYRYLDFLGDTVTPVDGKLAIGAVQTPLSPVAAFASDTTPLGLLVDGNRGLGTGNDSKYATYVFLGEDTWPRTFELSASLEAGEHLFAFGSSDSVTVRFPTKDGRALYVPEKGMKTSLSVLKANQVRYVDRDHGSDDGCDGSAATADGAGAGPFASIQRAVSSIAANTYGVIYVAEGVYDNGESEWGSGVRPKLRVMASSNRHQRIVATGAAERTVIRGAADTSGADRDVSGNGGAAVRCVRVASNCRFCLQGFTLTEGHSATADTPGAVASWRSGGAFMCEGGKTAWLMDCIISNNFAAASGAAMYGGRAARCRFYGNRCSGSTSPALFHYPDGGIFSCLANCEILADADTADSVFAAASTRLVHCSFSSPVAAAAVPNRHGYIFNSLIVGNTGFGGDPDSACSAGNVVESAVYTAGNARNSGAFACGTADYFDAAAGDLRLLTTSSAIGAGATDAALADTTRWTAAEIYENFYALLQHDLKGEKPALIGGRPTAGAYYRPSKAKVTIAVNLPEHVEVTPAAGDGFVDVDGSLVISAASDSRRIVAIEVNGELREDVSQVTVSPTAADGTAYDVRIYANTNWYVDAVHGDDSAPGWSEATARQSLNEIMHRAEPGDTVIALPGDYRLGMMLQDEPYHADSPTELYSRVVVPSGVRLVSRDGAGHTIISGMISEEANHFGYDSLRAVYMLPNSELRGFTVCGGSTFDNGAVDAIDDDHVCGGVFCAEAPSTTTEPTIWVKDCIISNNYAHTYAAGACYGGGFLRCRFFWNRCRSGGAHGVNIARLYECILDHGRATYGINQPYRARGCTFGADNMNYDETGARAALRSDPGSSAGLWPIWNCLFLGGAKCPVRAAHNCIVPYDGFIYTDRADSDWTDLIPASVGVDSKYAPNRTSAAINAANADYVLPMELEGDVYGHARNQRGGIDIGAVETGEPTALILMLE